MRAVWAKLTCRYLCKFPYSRTYRMSLHAREAVEVSFRRYGTGITENSEADVDKG